MRRLSVEAWQQIIDDIERLQSDYYRAWEALQQSGIVDAGLLLDNRKPWDFLDALRNAREKQRAAWEAYLQGKRGRAG